MGKEIPRSTNLGRTRPLATAAPPTRSNSAAKKMSSEPKSKPTKRTASIRENLMKIVQKRDQSKSKQPKAKLPVKSQKRSSSTSKNSSKKTLKLSTTRSSKSVKPKPSSSQGKSLILGKRKAPALASKQSKTSLLSQRSSTTAKRDRA